MMNGSKNWIIAGFLIMGLVACHQPQVLQLKGLNKVKVGEECWVELEEKHSKGENWILKNENDLVAMEYGGSSFHGEKDGMVRFRFVMKQANREKLYFQKLAYSDVSDSLWVEVSGE